MTRSIRRYPLEAQTHHQLEVPAGTRWLDVGVEGCQACVWALFVPDAEHTETHTVLTLDRQQQVPDGVDRHLGRVELPGGVTWFVFVAE